MVHKAIQEFLSNVDWGDLDYLLVDLPPGTGDAQMTLSQSVDMAGVVIVTTPQEVASVIASKASTLFRDNMKVPLLGIVENMSSFVCSHCQHESEIFGHGGGQEMAEALGAPLLGQIPLTAELVSSADIGELERLMRSGSVLARKATEVAEKIAARVSVGALAQV
jgi:ATP-binding protein involved in chromosome partitioning